jgi:hypothetical protein
MMCNAERHHYPDSRDRGTGSLAAEDGKTYMFRRNAVRDGWFHDLTEGAAVTIRPGRTGRKARGGQRPARAQIAAPKGRRRRSRTWLLSVQFRYLTGLKRKIFLNARLLGTWDHAGRLSQNLRRSAWRTSLVRMDVRRLPLPCASTKARSKDLRLDRQARYARRSRCLGCSQPRSATRTEPTAFARSSSSRHPRILK